MKVKKDYIIHSVHEIEGIRQSARAAAIVRDQLMELCQAGMSTKQLDELALSLISSQGGISAFHGYRGFPGQICISLNDEVVHGIGRDNRILENGDVVSLDIGVNLNGCIGDTACSFVLGREPGPDVKRLLDSTLNALNQGVKACLPGNHVLDISMAVEAVAKSSNLGVVRDYVGHGCGTKLHEPPEVPNFATKKKGARLQAGMVLCIEPMFNLGGHKVFTESDNWTVRTSDAKISAHFEHMILITEKEPEVLTWGKM